MVSASMLVNLDHKSECQLKKKKKKEVLWVIIMGSERVRRVSFLRRSLLSSLPKVSWDYLDKKNIEGRLPLGNPRCPVSVKDSNAVWVAVVIKILCVDT